MFGFVNARAFDVACTSPLSEGDAAFSAASSKLKFESETLAVAHHPAPAGAREMPAEHEHRRSGKAPQERPAGAIRLRGVEIRSC
jgi:hypothetical protein